MIIITNYHSDSWIMNKVNEHYEEALTLFPEERIVGIFLQGSQNYGLDYENSDVDTKLVLTPSFEDIAMNLNPISATYVRENGEYIDLKDVRLMLQTFKKQNINFIEILFTPYFMVNKKYFPYWNKLIRAREEIAHYNFPAVLKAMRDVAKEKYHAMELRCPSKVELIDKYGYDGKQLHHLYRIKEFIKKYILGESYESCLRPRDPSFLVSLKKNEVPLAEARVMADAAITDIDKLVNATLETWQYKMPDNCVDELLYSVQLDIMHEAIKEEFVHG